jgi:hypothetical protein
MAACAIWKQEGISKYEGDLVHVVGREMGRVGEKSLCGL